jgi:hypothetical protein
MHLPCHFYYSIILLLPIIVIFDKHELFIMNIDPYSPPPFLKNLIEDAFEKKTTKWLVPDCGLSAALRFSVKFEDDSRVFVKAATDDDTEQWLRREHLVLSSIKQKFAPAVIDWLEGPEGWHVLLTQDLSNAHWPASHQGVNWRNGDIDMVVKALTDVSSVKTPVELPLLENDEISVWAEIAIHPEPFLNLKLCSKEWFSQAIDNLIGAKKSLDVTGNALVHGDVRSDNICILDGQVIFVDWSHAAKGNPDNDLAYLLPTLYLEGGPAPYQVMPNGGSYASSLAAMHIRRLDWDTGMPGWLKNVFLKLIAIELEWAADCLGLGKPDGIDWRLV